MKLVRLVAENFKKLRAVDITPSDINIVGGKNESGKTSLLDSVQFAMRGKKAISGQPIRRGSKKTKVTADYGDIIVTRVLTGTRQQITIQGKDGSTYPNPESMLSSLIGDISMDPSEFYAAKPVEQQAILREIVGGDTTQLDVERADVYAARTNTNRGLKQVEAQLAAHPLRSEPEPVPPTNDLVAQLQQVERKTRDRHEIWLKREDAAKQFSVLTKQKLELEARLQELEVNLQMYESRIPALDKELESLPNPQELRSTLQNLDTKRNEAQAIRDSNEVHKRLAKEADELRQTSAGMTARIQEIDEKKRQILAESADKMPIPDLSFGEDGLTYKGLPLENASSSEQLEVSVAVAMARKPEISTIIIRQAAFLDQEKRERLIQIARQRGVQLFMELVGDDDACTIVIEDGEVREA